MLVRPRDVGRRIRLCPTLTLGAVLAAAVLGSLEGTARAYDKRACVAASDQGQGLRIDGKLVEAREQLLVCADASCPSIVRAACAGWLLDLDKQIPSVTLAARDGGGNDVLGVTVSLDGSPVPDAVSGRPVPLDPGTHTLRFVAPTGAAVDRVVVVGEGEQRRLIEAVFRGAATPLEPSAREAAPAMASVPPSRAGTPWAAWGVTIGAATAWAAFGAFALAGHLEYESAVSSCNGHCSPERYDAINTKFVVADVALGVAVVATGVATVLFLTHRSPSTAPAMGASGAVLSF
jgi:hypothetical protein